MVRKPHLRIIAIVQARMGSTRLPGKVLKELLGKPMLTRVINRSQRSKLVDEVVVATTINPMDESIVELCEKEGYRYYRGSEVDVLDRYYRAALKYKGDVIVRLCSDDPLIDSEIIDMVVDEFLSHYPEADYVSNTFPSCGFPVGLYAEAISFSALGRAWREDNNPVWREHVTPYIYRHPEQFKLYSVKSEVDYSHMRWTVDTPEDLTFVRKIYEYFGHDNFSWKDVLRLLKLHPEWLEINQHIQQKMVP